MSAVSVSYCYITSCPKLSFLKQYVCIIVEKSAQQLDYLVLAGFPHMSVVAVGQVDSSAYPGGLSHIWGFIGSGLA